MVEVDSHAKIQGELSRGSGTANAPEGYLLSHTPDLNGVVEGTKLRAVVDHVPNQVDGNSMFRKGDHRSVDMRSLWNGCEHSEGDGSKGQTW